MWLSEKARRITILGYIVILVIGLLLLRLAWLQILQGPQYKRVAEENRTRRITAPAPRGVIYDRNDAVLADNRPSFAVSIIPGEYTNPRDATPLLAQITGVSRQDIERMLNEAADFPYTPVRIKRNIDQATIAKIQERRYYLPGVIIEAVPVRYYPYKTLAAHLLGFVGSISESEYAARKTQGYHPNDLIGKDGLEREWETDLRGEDGGREVEVNAMGEEVRLIGDRPPVPGKAVRLTLDANLQKATEDALAEQVEASRKAGRPAKGGAAVVLDVKTGGVLALASNPAFDPNVFAGGIGYKEWDALVSNPANPLTNRVIQNVYPPGSVFKIITSAAVLETGLASPAEIIDDKGFYILNGWKFYGWETKGLGQLNVVGALAWSSDPYFYEMGRRLGPDNLAAYALTFGLGQKSGIGLAGEESGVVPTQEWKKRTYGEEWLPGETLIAAIGQGYYLVTPLQQALVLMAVANNGVIYRPLLADRVYNADGTVAKTFRPEVLRTVYLRPEVWASIREGLEAVTTRGTGAAVFAGMPQPVAGKTGSAETGRGTTHSWFACYAPADQPAIAVAVLIDEGGEGSAAAAPVARKILAAYFAKSG
ncbi:MAG: penicillin-binding protein 2 [Negativicutes bacterium]|nr:penicillin-binding protein 2 [Negativicutes bacterium]